MIPVSILNNGVAVGQFDSHQITYEDLLQYVKHF